MDSKAIRLKDNTDIDAGIRVTPAEPLWKLAPTRDEEGRLLSDFMMIIPKLKHQPQEYIQNTIRELEGVLNYYREKVVFVNLDMKINVLWVTLKPIPGLILELSAAIKMRVPEAMLVADRGAMPE